MLNMLTQEIRARIRSFGYAFEGWWFVLRTQHNAWIHGIVTVIIFSIGLWVRLSRVEWAILILTTMAIWMAEFINTAIEAVVDMASPEFHPLAKAAKDVGAAAVLIGAVGAVMIGLLIVGPPLWAKISLWF